MTRDSGNIIMLMLVDYCDFDLGPVFNQSYKYTYRGPLGGKVMALRSGAFVFHTDSAWAFTNTRELLLLTGVQYIFLSQSSLSHSSTASFIFQIHNSFTGLSQEKKKIEAIYTRAFLLPICTIVYFLPTWDWTSSCVTVGYQIVKMLDVSFCLACWKSCNSTMGNTVFCFKMEQNYLFLLHQTSWLPL